MPRCSANSVDINKNKNFVVYLDDFQSGLITAQHSTYIHSKVDEQVVRQRLGQHWFITVHMAACIQGLYTVYNGDGVRGTVTVCKIIHHFS